MNVELSRLDTERFGRRICRADLAAADNVQKVVAAARGVGAELLIVRVPCSDIDAVQQLEREGAILTDTLVHFARAVTDVPAPELPAGYSLAQVGKDSGPAIGVAAAECFRGYPGHYHADPRLDRANSDAVYTSWAMDSCVDSALADAVLAIWSGSEVAAFATVKRLGAEDFDGPLFGVAPAHRGQGLFTQLLRATLGWGHAQGLRSMGYSTQVTNISALRSICTMQFQPTSSRYTFHLWLRP